MESMRGDRMLRAPILIQKSQARKTFWKMQDLGNRRLEVFRAASTPDAHTTLTLDGRPAGNVKMPDWSLRFRRAVKLPFAHLPKKKGRLKGCQPQ